MKLFQQRYKGPIIILSNLNLLRITWTEKPFIIYLLTITQEKKEQVYKKTQIGDTLNINTLQIAAHNRIHTLTIHVCVDMKTPPKNRYGTIA